MRPAGVAGARRTIGAVGSEGAVVGMADSGQQQRWRRKVHLIKRQLNVMARAQTHEALDHLAAAFALAGKAEAVAFACFVTRTLMQRAEYDPAAARMLADAVEGYRHQRHFHAP
jgi:hypothetical protein